MISRGDDISDLIGETLTEVSGAERRSETITFRCASGRRFVLRHDYSCCERVSVEDVTGDVAAVRVETPWFVDYFHMGRFGERWVIVNAMWHMKPKAPAS